MPERSAVAYRDQIDAFKAQWPCHGFPDNLRRIHAYFDAKGDLVDLAAYGPDEYGADRQWLDTAEFDGPALVALVDALKASLPAVDPTPPVAGHLGAPLGRRSSRPGEEPEGKLYLRRVRLNSGGYDNGGAYWGLGAPLWWCGDGAAFDIYFRCRSRTAAKAYVLAMFPAARFHR